MPADNNDFAAFLSVKFSILKDSSHCYRKAAIEPSHRVEGGDKSSAISYSPGVGPWHL